MRLFDFSLKVNGFDINKAKQTLSKIQNKSDEDFKFYIEQQKRNIVSHHLEHNSFYKSFGKSIDLNHWNSIPIMTKRHLQQPIEQRFSDGFTPKNVYLNKTSGSSGNPPSHSFHRKATSTWETPGYRVTVDSNASDVEFGLAWQLHPSSYRTSLPMAGEIRGSTGSPP